MDTLLDTGKSSSELLCILGGLYSASACIADLHKALIILHPVSGIRHLASARIIHASQLQIPGSAIF